VRIRQFASTELFSERVPAHEMTARLGIEPDRIMVRGSQSVDPLLPRVHRWEIRCSDPGLAVDELFWRVLDRLEPYTDRIAALVRDLAQTSAASPAMLQAVRYFGDDEGEEELLSPPDAELVKIPGQHHLLGFHLDRRILDFLHGWGPSSTWASTVERAHAPRFMSRTPLRRTHPVDEVRGPTGGAPEGTGCVSGYLLTHAISAGAPHFGGRSRSTGCVGRLAVRRLTRGAWRA
jgi:hypothetical protein